MMKSMSWMVVALAGLSACAEPAEGEDTETPVEQTEASVLRWSLDGLEPLGDGYVYEGWIVVDGTPVSTGRFGVDSDGAAELDAYTLTEDQLAGAGAFVLSIEPEIGDDPAPSDVKLLGGDLDADGAADLSVAHPAALGDDLAGAMATYILATPSTASIMDDETYGIWFLDPTAGPGPSAMLPELPVGWTYEGWVVDASGPISTGTFDAGDMADSDAGGPAAGPDGTPPFPGQDFIDPGLDLVGLTAVISIEPVPDDSPAPFVLKPLVDAEIEDGETHSSQAMTNQADGNNPTGSVWIE